MSALTDRIGKAVRHECEYDDTFGEMSARAGHLWFYAKVTSWDATLPNGVGTHMVEVYCDTCECRWTKITYGDKNIHARNCFEEQGHVALPGKFFPDDPD